MTFGRALVCCCYLLCAANLSFFAGGDLCLSAVTDWDGVVDLQCRNVAQIFPFPFALQNPAQFGESDCDSSEGECSDATVRTNKPCSSATW